MFKKIQHNNQAYHYSQCAKNDFLSNWYKKRNIIKVELQKIKKIKKIQLLRKLKNLMIFTTLKIFLKDLFMN